MFQFYMGDFAEYLSISPWLIFALVGAETLIFYLLRSIGLFTLAKRQKVLHAWVSFLPLAWFYIACKLVGKSRFFNRPIEDTALILTIIFAVAELITLVSNVLIYYPIVGNLLAGNGDILIAPTGMKIQGFEEFATSIYVTQLFVNPYGIQGTITVNNILTVLGYISFVTDIVSLVVVITVYMGLFRRFWPQHYVLAMILSFLGLFAPFVFAIRKKDPIKFEDYLRSRYYGAYGNPYQNPYSQNPYNQNPYNSQNAQPRPQNPFEEFAEKGEKAPEDPFNEFNSNDKDKN